jgi:glycosyltransferase involved in cell wall biosynthesis
MGAMPRVKRNVLAFIEGFRKPAADRAQGTHQAAYLISQALANLDRYAAFDVYQEQLRSHGALVLPSNPPTRVFAKTRLQSTRDRYAAIYVANGEQIFTAPHLLRPTDDWAPVICSVGTAHANGQWANLFLSQASGAIRSSDAFIFKSAAAQALFRRVWGQWSQRFGFEPEVPTMGAVIPNGVDVELHRRSDTLRSQTRDQLGIHQDEVVYLSFSRLDPGIKGDLEALVLHWKQVLANVPQALLVLAGATADRDYVVQLRQLARATGAANRIIVVDNPYDLFPDARGSLMSAADVFVHPGTGIEEASPLAIHEAQAHSLPVIAARWAGIPEVVAEGETGFLIDTRVAPLRPQVATTLFGETDRTHLVHAGRTVWCDWRAFVNAASALADESRRAAMGAAARRREQSRDLQAVAREYVAVFEDASAAAEESWTGPVPPHPLVHLDDVLDSQAEGRLEPSHRLRLSDSDVLPLLTRGFYPESPAQLACLVDLFRTCETVSVADAAAAVAAFARAAYPTEFGDEADLAISSRLLVRLLNSGALELQREPA